MALSGTTKTFLVLVTILFLFFIITTLVMYFELEPLFDKLDNDDCINTIEKTCKLSKCSIADTKNALLGAWILGVIAFIIYLILIWWYTSGGSLFDEKPAAPGAAPVIAGRGFTEAVVGGFRPAAPNV